MNLFYSPCKSDDIFLITIVTWIWTELEQGLMKCDFEYHSLSNHGNSCQISFSALNVPYLRSFGFAKINDYHKIEISLRKEAHTHTQIEYTWCEETLGAEHWTHPKCTWNSHAYFRPTRAYSWPGNIGIKASPKWKQLFQPNLRNSIKVNWMIKAKSSQLRWCNVFFSFLKQYNGFMRFMRLLHFTLFMLLK